MTTNDHPECYGTLFPSLLRLPEDRPASGTVFTGTDKVRESLSRLSERLSLSSARTMGSKATPVTLSPPP
jgi:hypothetical protein